MEFKYSISVYNSSMNMNDDRNKIYLKISSNSGIFFSDKYYEFHNNFNISCKKQVSKFNHLFYYYIF